MKDLGSYLAELKATFPDQITRISDEIDLNYELNAIAFEYVKNKNVCLVFEKVKGYSSPLVTNVFGSKERIAFALGVRVDKIYDGISEGMSRKVKPTLADHAPVKDIIVKGSEVNLENLLPLPLCFEQDGGRYVTAGLVVAKNLDKTVTNLCFARMQLKGKNKFGISFHSRGTQFLNLQRAIESGKPLEVSVVIGGHPALHLAAAARIVDEYSAASALIGEPIELTKCESVDLEVPANAEIVLEGEVSPILEEDEGPFSEYSGYVSGRSTRNVLHINTVTHRKKPLFLSVLASNSPEHILLSNITREARTVRSIKEFLPVARITAANWPISGVRFVCFLSLEKPIQGLAKQVALLTMGTDLYAKIVVVTDNSVDVTDFERVLAAVARNMRWNGRSDFEIIDRVFCNVLDPSSRDGMQSKILIDATSKGELSTRRIKVPDEMTIMHSLGSYNIKDLRFCPKCDGLVVYLKATEGDARELGKALFGVAPDCRIVIILDPDIDIGNGEEILWAIATRVVPKEDFIFLSGNGSKVVIDSRKASDFHAIRPTVPPAIDARAKAFFAEYVG